MAAADHLPAAAGHPPSTDRRRRRCSCCCWRRSAASGLRRRQARSPPPLLVTFRLSRPPPPSAVAAPPSLSSALFSPSLTPVSSATTAQLQPRRGIETRNLVLSQRVAHVPSGVPVTPGRMSKVRASHLLVKYSGSRRPASWRDPEGAVITKKSKEQALQELMQFRQQIVESARLPNVLLF